MRVSFPREKEEEKKMERKKKKKKNESPIAWDVSCLSLSLSYSFVHLILSLSFESKVLEWNTVSKLTESSICHLSRCATFARGNIIRPPRRKSERAFSILRTGASTYMGEVYIRVLEGALVLFPNGNISFFFIYEFCTKCRFVFYSFIC